MVICLQCRRLRFDRWVGRIPWRRKWQPTLVFLSGKSHGQRSLAGCSPWGCRRAGCNLATKEHIYVCVCIWAALDLCCCAQAFSSSGSPGLSPAAGLRLLAAVTSPYGLGSREGGLSSCSAGAWLSCVVWDLPGPGIEPASPALAGSFLTTRPPGKPKSVL